jgi:hypothetical protein
MATMKQTIIARNAIGWLSSGNAAHSQHHYLFGGTPVPVDQLEAMGPLSTSIGHLHTVVDRA